MSLLFTSDKRTYIRLIRLFEYGKLGVESKQGNGWDIRTRNPRKLISFIIVAEPDNPSMQGHEPFSQVIFRERI